MTVTPTAKQADYTLDTLKAKAVQYQLSKEWALDKAAQLKKAGDSVQAEDFKAYASGRLSIKELEKRWAYKYWTVATINRGVSDPYLPKSTMTDMVLVDTGSYLHPANPLHETLGVSYLNNRNKHLIEVDGEFFVVSD